jgi:hypothetical protein
MIICHGFIVSSWKLHNAWVWMSYILVMLLSCAFYHYFFTVCLKENCSDTSTLEYPIQVGSDTRTACLLDIYFLKYLSVISNKCALSQPNYQNIPSQHIINGSLSVYWSLSGSSTHFPPSSNGRSLNQISLKEPNAVALHDDFGLLQPYTVMVAEKLYTRCVLLSMMVCTVVCYQPHATRFYPTAIARVNTK